MSHSYYNAHTEPLYQQLNILDFHKLVIQRTALTMFKYSSNNLPSCIKVLFIRNNEIHNDTSETYSRRIATGCTTDTSTQHLHDEADILPIKEHIQLHTSQIRRNSQHPTHPLHYITTQQTTPRRKKQTTYNNTDYTTDIDTNPNTIDDAKIKTNMKHTHTTIVSAYLNSRQHIKVTNIIPLTVHHSSTILPRVTRRTLAQLRTNKCPILHSYLNKNQ